MEKVLHQKTPPRYQMVYADKETGVFELDIFTAPHTCADPECPGEINRRKLEAAEEMARALQQLINYANSFDVFRDNIGKGIKKLAQTALTSWDKAGKGEG